MNKISIILTSLAIVCVFVSSSIPDSEAKLWDFVVNAEFLKSPINEGKNQILHGTVVDHAYHPVADVNVKITFSGISYILKTNELGEFGKELDVTNLKPRTYTVHLFASTDDGKKGMLRTTFQLDGHNEKSAKFQRQLESMEMVYDPSKLRKNSNDPISVILYQHYLELQEKINNEDRKEELLKLPQQKIKEIRDITNQKLLETLEERPLPSHQFDDSYKLNIFLDTLDDDKRLLFESQLNSTKLRFIQAQNIMQNILDNGGTKDDARQAYLEHLSITQEEMNSFTLNIEKTEISSKPSTNSTEN